VVLATTALLLVGGTLAIWLLSRGADGPGAPGLLECAFLSTSARTAGFTTIDTALWSHPALLVVILLMIVGGSPGSTAGGIKTTSLAALMAVILSRHRNRPGIELFHRQIAAEVVAKALVSFAGMLAAILFGVLLLEVAESGLQPHAILGRQRFFDHLFEVVSALGTVGLSTGVTSTLGPAGRLILIVCMFLGRIGPLLVATSLIGHRRRVAMNYANEDILVG
jgi:trk system potassium uptake protein TrkH